MWQLFIASFCDQTEIEGNGRQQTNMTNDKKLKQQALLKLKKWVKSKQTAGYNILHTVFLSASTK